MFKTLKDHISHEPTQREPLPGTVRNNAGGYSYATDQWQQFERFLILGTTEGTYYVSERKLTEANLDAVKACIKEDGITAVNCIVEVSQAGSSPKNDAALFALALAASCDQPEVRAYALANLLKVCRTFTHLSHFLTFIKQGKMRGWGRQFCRAIAQWFNAQTPGALVNQVIKYQSRDGWSQKDVYRMCHPRKFANVGAAWAGESVIFDYIAKGTLPVPEDLAAYADTPIERLAAAHKVLRGEYQDLDLIDAISHYNLPMEVVPTELQSPAVYEAVLASAGLTWVLRNLANMTKHGLMEDKEMRKFITTRLTDSEQLKKARVHPLNIFGAMRTYQQGHGEKGKSTWTPHRDIVDALDAAFYEAFNYVESSNAKVLLAVDCSNSMHGCMVAGMRNVQTFEAAAIMAMAAAKAEENFRLIAFTTGGNVWHLSDISHRQRLDDIVKVFQHFNGGTDTTLPFLAAAKEKWDTDLFAVFTDSETWAGNTHPIRAFEAYKQTMNKPDAKAINIAMTANNLRTFPLRPDCMEIVGFDTSVPAAISLFAKQ